ncbi:hypothetical protein HDU96_000206, partial [Phlyctochytrium bullatum]
MLGIARRAIACCMRDDEEEDRRPVLPRNAEKESLKDRTSTDANPVSPRDGRVQEKTAGSEPKPPIEQSTTMSYASASSAPLPTPDPLPFTSRRSAVYSTRGIVATSQPLATRAGLQILAQGGNAADAAVACAAVLNCTEPCSTGIGGDAFCLFWDAKEKKVKALNASGRAPEALTLEVARSLGIEGESIPGRNLNSVTVPGAAAGWADTIELFGSGKLTLKEILAPAIKIAEEGFPITPLTGYFWKRAENTLKNAPNGKEMLKNGERAPQVGEIMKMPNLAKTFRRLAEQGKPGFYAGQTATAIANLIQSQGGVMSLTDLASHTSTPGAPIAYTYHPPGASFPPTTLHECPPNGQGLAALMCLGLLDALQRSGRV